MIYNKNSFYYILNDNSKLAENFALGMAIDASSSEQSTVGDQSQTSSSQTTSENQKKGI